MDAERINQIEAKISDLTARLVELRGYLWHRPTGTPVRRSQSRNGKSRALGQSGKRAKS